MNKLKITLNEDGSVIQFTPDFKIMRGSYRNVLINIEVPHSLLIDPVVDTDDSSNQTGNNVRIGAIIRTATGQNLQTQRYEFQRVKDYILNGVYYRLYQRRMPKEFTMWETVNLLEATNSGVLEMVINVTNWTLDENSNAKIEEVAASQIFTLDIYPSAFLENAENIDEPSDFDELQSQVQEIDAKQDEVVSDLYGTDTNTLGTYLPARLKAGNKITIEEDTSLTPNNKLKISVQTINANEVPISPITEISATDVQGALKELSERSDNEVVDTLSGEDDYLVDNTDPRNPIIKHDIAKADLVESATADNLAKLTSDGNLADSGKKISDLVLVADVKDNLTSTDINKPLSANQGTNLKNLVDQKENSANKNANNGYCALDSGGKVPLANLPSTLLKYQGVWNASTNSPTLINPDLTKANYVYNVGTAGTQFGITWKLGDWLIYNVSGVPEKSDNSDDVVSVNGQTGVVTLNTSHISATTDKNYVTDAEKTKIANTSGTNTGDQDLSGLVPNTRTVNGHSLSSNVTVTKSDVGLSNAYNPTAYGGISYGGGLGESGISFTDLNSLVYTGFYTCYGTTANVPSASCFWFIQHINSNIGNVSATQIAIAYGTTTIIYKRNKTSSTWGAWENISPSLKENVVNKVVSISSSSTDTEYPSAKCVYDIVGDIETLLGGI